MLPDFKKTKTLIANYTTMVLDARIKAHMGGFGTIASRRLHEGSGFITEFEDGGEDDSDLQQFHSRADIDIVALLKNPNEIFLQTLEAIAIDHAAKQSQMIVDRVSEVTTKAGNTSSFKGLLTADEFLDGLALLQIEFTTQGRPLWPSIVTEPEMQQHVRKLLEEIRQSPELTTKYNKIEADQRKNWYDRAANRKLVD